MKVIHLAIIQILALSVLGNSLKYNDDTVSFTVCSEPRSQECPTDEVVPTCGQLKDGTKQNFNNPCEACRNDNVQGYESQKCQDNNNVTICDDVPENCDAQYQPVCATFSDGSKKTFSNGCVSCSENAQKYTLGVCPKQDSNINIQQCPKINERVQGCTEEFEVGGYCGVFFENQYNQQGFNYQSNYGTFCQACQDDKVDFVFKGQCDTYIDPQENDKNIHYCQTNPENCDDYYDPVCGFKSDGTYNTKSNECYACSEQYQFYVKGECKQQEQVLIGNEDDDKKHKCPKISERQTICTEEFEGEGYCGIFFTEDEDGNNQKSGYGTVCQVCADFKVEYYKKGQCKGDIDFSSISQFSFYSLLILIILLN